jgi:hypothetical protein
MTPVLFDPADVPSEPPNCVVFPETPTPNDGAPVTAVTTSSETAKTIARFGI